MSPKAATQRVVFFRQAAHSFSCFVQLAPCWTLNDKHCRRSSSLTFVSTFFNLAILFRSFFICFVTATFCACKAARRSLRPCSVSDKEPLLGLPSPSGAGAAAASMFATSRPSEKFSCKNLSWKTFRQICDNLRELPMIDVVQSHRRLQF